jgi:hypothetical protein
MSREVSSESIVKDIRRKTRKRFSVEEKIRIVLEGLRGEDSISGLCLYRHRSLPHGRANLARFGSFGHICSLLAYSFRPKNPEQWYRISSK